MANGSVFASHEKFWSRENAVDCTVLALMIFLVSFLTSGALQGLENITMPLWPASGLALALVMQAGPRLLPGVFAGLFFRCVTAGDPWFFAISAPLGNMVETLLAWGIFQVPGQKISFFGLKMHSEFSAFLVASVTAPLLAASMGAGALHFSGIIPEEEIRVVWMEYYSGNVLGIFLFTPFFLFLLRGQTGFRSELMLKNLQIERLQARIDPHFLFNSLATIKSLVRQDPLLAREAIDCLSDILRAGIRNRPFATLGQEIETVRGYLRLEELRFSDRFAVSIQCPDELLDLRFPPMLLQTIVENAIKHGIFEQARRGQITVIARSEGGKTVIEVNNPGRILNGKAGTGLKNSRQRLRLLYGRDASLTISEEPGDRVCARISLPGIPPLR